jgi:hypothetical protein
MKQRLGSFPAACAVSALLILGPGAASAQITQAAGYTPPDDTPSVKVGGTIYANFEYQQEPTATDADGNTFHPNAFNVTRAYINVTGQINHLVSFRITPDVVRVGNVNGTDLPGLSGTLAYRLKYGYGQFNFDDFDQTVGVLQWKGSWMRLGLQQTPFIDYAEQIYRYRFQGTIFVEREGFLTSSDLGASAHLNLPENYGDLHIGYYNGEGYTRPELNNTKAFQVRGSIRPLPNVEVVKGLRLTGFYDHDEYVIDAKKERIVGEATFENPYVNAGFDYLWNQDQNASATKPIVKSDGYSVWVTPRTPFGLEALIRYDWFEPVQNAAAHKERFIVGPAYWFNTIKGVAASVLLGYEQVKYIQYSPARPKEERYGVYTLFNF